jgi:hypothetical protein
LLINSIKYKVKKLVTNTLRLRFRLDFHEWIPLGIP